MNIAEGEVQITAQALKQMFVDLGPMKNEVQCGSFQDSVDRRNAVIENSEVQTCLIFWLNVC
jgi:hypothetical protein